MKKFKTVGERKAFDSGVVYLKHYIAFCILEYVYQFNLSGIAHFFNDLSDFLKGADYIPNRCNNISFKEFCKQHSIDE